MIKYSISHELEQLAEIVVDCGFQVHKALGPGLLESAYEACMAHELSLRSIRFKTQVPLPVVYKNVTIDAGYRIDLLIEDKIIIELKAVEKMNPLYEAQIITYLKMTGIPLGFLMNFNTLYFKDGIKRIVYK